MYTVYVYSNKVNNFPNKMEFIKGKTIKDVREITDYERIVKGFLGEEVYQESSRIQSWYEGVCSLVTQSLVLGGPNEHLPQWFTTELKDCVLRENVLYPLILRIVNLNKDAPLPVIIENKKVILLFGQDRLEEIPNELVSEIIEL